MKYGRSSAAARLCRLCTHLPPLQNRGGCPRGGVKILGGAGAKRRLRGARWAALPGRLGGGSAGRGNTIGGVSSPPPSPSISPPTPPPCLWGLCFSRGGDTGRTNLAFLLGRGAGLRVCKGCLKRTRVCVCVCVSLRQTDRRTHTAPSHTQAASKEHTRSADFLQEGGSSKSK